MSALHILPDGGPSRVDLFLASAASDFPFAARVHMMHHREATHIKTGASPVTAHHTPLTSCQTLLLSCGKGQVIFQCQTGRQRERVDTPALLSLYVHFPDHLFFLFFFASFTILASAFGTLPLHSLQALQGGGGWWRSERDYDRHGMKVLGGGASGKKIKLLLSELARSVCTRRAICRGEEREAI